LAPRPGEQQRGRLAYAAARARDRDDFAFYAGHEDILSNRVRTSDLRKPPFAQAPREESPAYAQPLRSQ
jgi:hypothetical protein